MRYTDNLHFTRPYSPESKLPVYSSQIPQGKLRETVILLFGKFVHALTIKRCLRIPLQNTTAQKLQASVDYNCRHGFLCRHAEFSIPYYDKMLLPIHSDN